jgi:hypothetical protein
MVVGKHISHQAQVELGAISDSLANSIQLFQFQHKQVEQFSGFFSIGV